MAKKDKHSEESAEMVPVNGNAGLAPAPSYLGTGQEGLENVRAKDMAWPRLRLIQKTSPEVDTREASPGDIMNDLTREVILTLDEELDLIPVYHFVSWIEWAPIDSGGGIVAASTDGKSELAMRASKGDLNAEGKPAVTEYHNFVSILPDKKDYTGVPATVLLSFSKTSFKTGRRLLMLAKMRRKQLFAGRYVLSTKMVTKGKNTWYEYTIDNSTIDGGWASEAIFKAAAELYKEAAQQVKDLDAAKIAAADDGHEIAADAEVSDGPKGKSDNF